MKCQAAHCQAEACYIVSGPGRSLRLCALCAHLVWKLGEAFRVRVTTVDLQPPAEGKRGVA